MSSDAYGADVSPLALSIRDEHFALKDDGCDADNTARKCMKMLRVEPDET
jgi:hypothetical protein